MQPSIASSNSCGAVQLRKAVHTAVGARSTAHQTSRRDNNVRQGFIGDEDYRRLESMAREHALKPENEGGSGCVFF